MVVLEAQIDASLSGIVIQLASSRVVNRRQPSPERGNAGLGLVVHYAEAGDLDTAFEHLQRAIDVRDPALVHLAVAPQWDSLRTDPRFNECLVRMKLQRVTLDNDRGRLESD